MYEKRIRKLFDSGLTTLSISVYDGPKEAEQFQTLWENEIRKSIHC